MAGVEKHQSSGAAIRKMMFNVARKERFFKRISGKNRKMDGNAMLFPAKDSPRRFRSAFFGKHIEKTAFSG